jgi:hypothetical protein
MADGCIVLAIPYKRYDPSRDWMLAIEHPYAIRYTRTHYLSRQGELIEGGRRLKSLTFPSAEEAADFLRSWVTKKRIDLSSLDFAGFAHAASSEYDPDVQEFPPVKEIREFMRGQTGWSAVLVDGDEVVALELKGKKITNFWRGCAAIGHPMSRIVAYNDGSWRHIDSHGYGSDYQEVARGRSADSLRAHLNAGPETPSPQTALPSRRLDLVGKR